MKVLEFAKKPVVKKTLLWGGIAVVVFTLGGFLILPAVLKFVLPGQLQKVLYREATIGDISFHPFTLKMRVKDFSLRDRDGGTQFLSFAELFLDVRLPR